MVVRTLGDDVRLKLCARQCLSLFLTAAGGGSAIRAEDSPRLARAR